MGCPKHATLADCLARERQLAGEVEARARLTDVLERTIWLRVRETNAWRRLAAFAREIGAGGLDRPPPGIERAILVWHAPIDTKRRSLRAHALYTDWDREGLCPSEDAWLHAQRGARLSLWEARGAGILADAATGVEAAIGGIAAEAGELVLARALQFGGTARIDSWNVHARRLSGDAAIAAREALARPHALGWAARVTAAWREGLDHPNG